MTKTVLTASEWGLRFWKLVFWICLEFRYSNFLFGQHALYIGGLFYVFIESIFIIAIGAKMKTGSHDQNCGYIRPNTGSVDNSLQMKMVMKQTPTIEKLAMMADFISLGSRQTRTGKQSISITKLMMGSVAWKCICEKSCARSFVWPFWDANCCNCIQLSIDLFLDLRRIGISLAPRSLG